MRQIHPPEIPDQCRDCPVVLKSMTQARRIQAQLDGVLAEATGMADESLGFAEGLHGELSEAAEDYGQVSGQLAEAQQLEDVLAAYDGPTDITLAEFIAQAGTNQGGDENELLFHVFTALADEYPDLLDQPLKRSLRTYKFIVKSLRAGLKKESSLRAKLAGAGETVLDSSARLQNALYRRADATEAELERNYRLTKLCLDNCDSGPINQTKGVFRKKLVLKCGTAATRQMYLDQGLDD